MKLPHSFISLSFVLYADPMAAQWRIERTVDEMTGDSVQFAVNYDATRTVYLTASCTKEYGWGITLRLPRPETFHVFGAQANMTIIEVRQGTMPMVEMTWRTDQLGAAYVTSFSSHTEAVAAATELALWLNQATAADTLRVRYRTFVDEVKIARFRMGPPGLVVRAVNSCGPKYLQ